MNDLGKRGENLAAAYLEGKGYRVLARNYRFQRAEVDLVCFDAADQYENGGELVFVEVKTRTSDAYGTPEASIDEAKRKNLTKAARFYLYEHKMEGARCRFDVVAISVETDQAEYYHIENAF